MWHNKLFVIQLEKIELMYTQILDLNNASYVVQNYWESNAFYLAHTKGEIIEVLSKDAFCVHMPGFLKLGHS